LEAIKTTGLSKAYGGKMVLQDASVSVPKGCVYGLIGQNGAGKTTLIRILAALSEPTSGTVEIFGASDPAGLSKARARMGSIVETPAMYPGLTASQNLEYYRIQRGIPEKGIVQKTLELVGLADTGNKKSKHFSLGMRQRLGVALAILGSPDLIILDEPMNGLDPMGIIEMRDMIRRFSSAGITVLISSHVLSELSQVGTKYAILHKGWLIREFSREELQDECRRALVVTADDVGKAARVLETELGAKDCKHVGANELRVYGMLDKAEEILSRLAQNGVRVSGLREVGDSLEEFFMKAIGESKGGKWSA
jgi:ABC-2 type transport system ATP-binding protein